MNWQIVQNGRLDADQLADLHKSSFHWSWDRTVMQKYLTDRSVLTIAASANGNQKLCGFAMTRFVADEAEILTVSVDPIMRRNGIGKALCQETLEALARKDIETLHLEVSEANQSALSLYQDIGFEETGRRKSYYPNPKKQNRLDAVLMQFRIREALKIGALRPKFL